MPKSILTLESVVTQSPDLVGSSIESQTALMSVQNGAYYGLDAVGSRIWALIEAPRCVAAICDSLMAEYQVERTQCEKQALNFLQKLADADLLKIS